jgi:hypothetical protein
MIQRIDEADPAVRLNTEVEIQKWGRQRFDQKD